MSINRDVWLKSFSKDNFPNWNCPQCKTGILRPIETTFHFHESGDITREKLNQGEYFNYDAYTFIYTVFLKCNNLNCQESVSSCGHGYVIEDLAIKAGELIRDKYGYPERTYTEVFSPEYFFPPIDIFLIPKQCPAEVVRDIRASFKLFFSDPPASANYVRKTVDSILTNRKIKRKTINSKGKTVSINLHDRIIEFEKSKPELAQQLFAIKWLGNEGSHSNKITKDDILDAYEILELVIDELYIGYKRMIEKKVLKINKNKRPLHPKT